jgi:acyl carrier protein
MQGASDAPEQTPKLERVFAVLDRTNTDVTDRVTQLVRRMMSKQAIAQAIGHDDDLRASGLSSLGLVNLMLTVETEFAIKIPERDMTPANFRSVARIADLVRGLSQQPAAAQ